MALKLYKNEMLFQCYGRLTQLKQFSNSHDTVTTNPESSWLISMLFRIHFKCWPYTTWEFCSLPISRVHSLIPAHHNSPHHGQHSLIKQFIDSIDFDHFLLCLYCDASLYCKSKRDHSLSCLLDFWSFPSFWILSVNHNL